MKVEYEEGSTIAVILMNRQENRLNFEFLSEFNRALDEIESNSNVRVVITVGMDRFYSSGIDLDFFSANPDKIADFYSLFLSTLQRLLTFPILTIAAINGHAFAGGLMLALSHDLRVMRIGRGWLSLNEIYLRLRIPASLIELVKCKVSPGPVRHQLFVLGKRFTAEEALAACLIDKSARLENLLGEAKSLGREVCQKDGFDRQMLHQMKCDVYRHTVDVMSSRSELSMFSPSRDTQNDTKSDTRNDTQSDTQAVKSQL